MTTPTTDLLYAACAAPRCSVHAVSESAIRLLTGAYREVDRIAHEEGVTDLLRRHLSRVRTIRFILAASPVNGSDPELRLAALSRRLAEAEQELEWSASPRLIAAFKRVRPAVEDLSRLHESPLQVRFAELWHSRDQVRRNMAVVVPDHVAQVATAAWLRRSDLPADLPVITPSALRGGEHYDRLFLFGPPRWHTSRVGDFLFAAPRAGQMDVIGYRWMDLALRTAPLFRRPPVREADGEPPGPSPTQSQRILVPPPEPAANEAEEPRPSENDEPAAVPVDVQEILRNRRQGSAAAALDADEEVEARMVILAGGHAVLLPWTDDATSFCADFGDGRTAADPEDEGGGIVRKQPNLGFEPGDFILLRTGAGGDILPQEADAIMGTAASGYRARQHEWKHALRALDLRLGPSTLCERLRTAGASHASIANMRNWIRERTIRPDADEDLRAILQVVGLAARTDEFFHAAGVINSAHRSAGFRIRRLLLAKVRGADLRGLRLTGMMEFRLDGLSAEASITAYRIEAVLPEVVMARSHEVNDVFPLEDNPWQ